MREKGSDCLRSDFDTAELEKIRVRTLGTLRDVVGRGQDVAILDVPNQRNVGDSLIWAGEVAYLEQLGCRTRYASDLRGYDAERVRRALPSGGVVLIHGGGNFGDLWPGHQALREKIVSELTDYRVVQLPQSVFFQDEERAAAADAVMSKHPDLTVLLRDSLSMERAQLQLPGVRTEFCPDMALGYEPGGVPSASKSAEVLVIARADHESNSGLNEIGPGSMGSVEMRITDWWIDASEPVSWRVARCFVGAGVFLVKAKRKSARLLGMPVPVPQLPQSMMQRSLAKINRLNINHAFELYSSASGMLVDRLHAHVLAALMGIEHVMLDNNYRKLGAVFDDYTHVFSTAHYSEDLSDACEQLRQRLDT